ncbi:MAG: aminopeptidase P family protein [Planctomycetes bacterium]|nr:aminopeptidase P family protein [Planctomycetota bacterium]
MPNSTSRRELLALSAQLAGAGALGACTSPARTAEPERAERLEDLFDDLSDQRALHAPIGPEERRARRLRLGRLLERHGCDAYFCEGGPTMSYLTGFSWGKSERAFGLVVLADGTHFWICPAFEAEKAKLALARPDSAGGALATWEEHEYAWAPLASQLNARRVSRIAIDPATRCFIPEELRAAFGAERVTMGRSVLVDLRGVKDEHELRLLRAASELTQRAIASVARHVRVGMTGDDVSAIMALAHQKLGMTNPWCLALVGAAAAYPHGDNHTVELQPGDFLLVDTGASYHGYQSDTTRTWCVEGQPSETQQRAWFAVREAQRAAFETIRPGVRCSAVDASARAVLEQRGFGAGYRALTHRLGHGIGVEGHEDPYFDGGSQVELAPGMTLSNEPGVYVLGEYGVRLEDIVQCTAEGADHFGQWQAHWSSPA